jgi:hypothetical protein
MGFAIVICSFEEKTGGSAPSAAAAPSAAVAPRDCFKNDLRDDFIETSTVTRALAV